jgi:hypothetical protein
MKVKWLVLLWMFAMLVLVSPIQHAIASTNVSGGIDYTKSQLTPTLEQGAKKNPPNNNGGGGGGGGNGNGEEEDDRPWWKKVVDVAVDKVKKGAETVVETVKDAGEYISDKTSEIVDATTEWWNERSLLEKSLIIVGVIATVVTLGAAAGVISAGAALTMGVMGAANYALYAATTDNVSFWGGLMWGGLGMVGGGIGLAAKGAKFLAPARAALSSGKAAIVGRLGALVPAAVKGSRFYPMIASAARTIIPGMMKGAVAGSGLAVYTHMAKWAITGETPNWGDVARDAMIWGASGAVAGGIFKPVTNVASKFVSKGKAMVAGASSSAGSESVVSDWLEGKNIDLKKAAIAASAVVVLGGAGVLATQMTNKSVKQVASTTELATDTAKVAKADDLSSSSSKSNTENDIKLTTSSNSVSQSKETPSDTAVSWQGSKPYYGKDRYRDITLKKGKIVYAGYPFPSGYMTTDRAISRVNNDAQKLFRGLQVAPYRPTTEDQMHLSGYRKEMMPYEMVDDIPAAFGITRANPGLGEGGLPQIFVPDFKKLLEQGKIREIPEGRIDLENWYIDPEEVDKLRFLNDENYGR